MGESYCTVAELRGQIGKTGTSDDAQLQILIDGASEAIDAFCNRPDGFVADTRASARVYTGSGGPWQRIDECVEITLVAVKDSPDSSTYTSWAATDWVAFAGDPERPEFQPTAWGKPYDAIMCTADGDYSTWTSGQYVSRGGFRPSKTVGRGVPTVQVTAKWGYSLGVPPVVKQACLTQAARWYKRGSSAWADTLASPDLGQLMFRKTLDPDVEMMLVSGRYVKPAVG